MTRSAPLAELAMLADATAAAAVGVTVALTTAVRVAVTTATMVATTVTAETATAEVTMTVAAGSLEGHLVNFKDRLRVLEATLWECWSHHRNLGCHLKDLGSYLGFS